MSTKDSKKETPLASEAALAESEQHNRLGGEGSIGDGARAKQRLVEQCLASDQRAWERLYRKCHPRLRKAIELLLGSDAQDGHLVDEIAARVWYALLQDDCRLLAAYDPDRVSSLDAFLMGLARIEILRYTRSERRRYSHEMIGGRKRLEEQRVSDCRLAAMMEDFASTLTPGERDFMEQFLTGPAEGPPDADLDDVAATTVWTRRYRIRRKLNEFLRNF